MKKLTTLFLALFISAFQFINSQEYHPLIEEGKSWDDITCLMCGICPNHAKRYFYTGQDTLINGLVYSNIGHYNFIGFAGVETCPPYSVDTIPFTGTEFMHEDTTERKVYIWKNNQPELLYDFSLQVGDTLISEWVTFSYGFVVAEIEDVELLNGETRKRWVFESEEWGGEIGAYIEGIGMETGLFGDFVQFEWWSELMCVQIDGEQLWDGGFSSWGGCYGLVGEDEIATEDLQIYPNPASDFIRISIPENIDMAGLKIFNSLGQVVFEGLIQSENAIIDVSKLGQGMYFVLIKSENNIKKEKLIIR